MSVAMDLELQPPRALPAAGGGEPAAEADEDLRIRDAEVRNTNLPPRSAWKAENCCVPLELLLENYDVKVRRGKLKRGMLFYTLWLAVLLVFAFVAFGSPDSALLYTAALLRASVTASTFASRSYFFFTGSDDSAAEGSELPDDLANLRRRADDDRRLQSSSTSSCEFSATLPAEFFRRDFTQRIRPFEATLIEDYFAYFANYLSLYACQPGAPNGVCAPASFQKQKRSNADDAPACLAYTDGGEAAFPNPDFLCSAVKLLPSSKVFCFGGFGVREGAQDDLNELWTRFADQAGFYSSDARGVNGCLAIPFGSQTGCYLGSSDWYSYPLNTSTSNAAFVERIANLKFSMQLNRATPSTVDPDSYEFAWVDGNTRSLTTAITTTNSPADAQSMLRISFQVSLSGVVTVTRQVLALAQLNVAAEDAKSASTPGTLMAVTLAFVITYIATTIFFPLARALFSLRSNPTGLVHYWKYWSWWNLVDIVLLVLYSFLLMRIVRSGFARGRLAPASAAGLVADCELESYMAEINKTKQLTGLLLLFTSMRLMKYIALVPALSQTWGAILSGFYYYTPALIMLAALWLVFALVNLIALHNHFAQFSDFYNALLSVVIMHIDSGSAAWSALMEPQRLVGLPSEAAQDSEVQFFTLLWLFEFFVVIPFTALAIAAFYFAVVFTSVNYRQRNEQAIADARASKAQKVLSELRESASVSATATNAPAASGQTAPGGSSTQTARIVGAGPDELATGESERTRYTTRLDKILDTYAGAPEHAGTLPTSALARAGLSGNGLRQSARAVKEFFLHCFLRTKLFFTNSERALEAVADLRNRKRNRISQGQALYRLQVFAAKPENADKVFISYNEIVTVIGTKSNGKRVNVPEDMVVATMNLVGAGNVYYSNVKRRYETRGALRARAGALVKPTATDIAAAEGRRRRIAIDQWQEATTDAAVVHALTERLHKLEETSSVSLKILLHDFRSVNAQQDQMLRYIENIRRNVEILRDPPPSATYA